MHQIEDISLSFIKYNEMVPTPPNFFFYYLTKLQRFGGCHVGNAGIWVTR